VVDRMEFGITTTFVISSYHDERHELESHTWWVVFHTTLCDKVCQWLV